MIVVKDSIPHREPFLFVDEVVHISESSITTKKFVSKDEDFFKGHYPEYPIMPGVLICEAILQSGAILVGNILKENINNEIPVVTRMNNIKLKQMVMPNSLLEIDVEFVEKISNAFYLKGSAKVQSKKVAYIEFACGLVKKNDKSLI